MNEYEKLAQLEGVCGWNIGRRRILEAALSTSMGRAGWLNILEVGCGTGGNIDFLKRAGHTSGLDSNPVALKYATDKGYDELVLGSAEAMPYAEGAFDVVGAFDMLEHIEDDAAALREMRRVLKGGGCLLLTVPAHPWLWTQHDVALHHKRRYTLKELRDKIVDAGFRIEKLSMFMMPTLPYLTVRGLLDRLKGPSKRESAKSYHAALPWAVNTGLAAWLEVERCLLRVTSLPFGGSILAVARKVEDAKGSST